GRNRSREPRRPLPAFSTPLPGGKGTRRESVGYATGRPESDRRPPPRPERQGRRTAGHHSPPRRLPQRPRRRRAAGALGRRRSGALDDRPHVRRPPRPPGSAADQEKWSQQSLAMVASTLAAIRVFTSRSPLLSASRAPIAEPTRLAALSRAISAADPVRGGRRPFGGDARRPRPRRPVRGRSPMQVRGSGVPGREQRAPAPHAPGRFGGPGRQALFCGP